jgi:hypothetical protein
MNMETLQEAYRQLQRDYIKAQNKLQDIGFVLADALHYTQDIGSAASMYIRKIVNVWERD